MHVEFDLKNIFEFNKIPLETCNGNLKIISINSILCEFVKTRVRLVKYTCSLFSGLTPALTDFSDIVNHCVSSSIFQQYCSKYHTAIAFSDDPLRVWYVEIT